MTEDSRSIPYSGFACDCLNACVRGLPDASAASFSLRDVTLDLVDVSAGNSADELAAAVVNAHLWKRIDGELSRDGGFPIHDVDLADRDLRIAGRHLLQTWRQPSARRAPICIKIDNGHIAQREMLVDVYLRPMRNDFDRLTATCERRFSESLRC